MNHIIENAKTMKGILICNTNPFLVAANILKYLSWIKANYPILKLRIDQFEEDLFSCMICMLDNFNDPYKIRKLLKQTDSNNLTVLQLLSDLDLYKLLQTKVADRVVKDTWSSRVDISGYFFENSKAFNYLLFDELESGEADDLSLLFKSTFRSRDLDKEARPHNMSYIVWNESMSLRYFVEMVLFIVQVLFFQLYITQFNTDMHKLTVDVEKLLELGVFAEDDAGHIFALEGDWSSHE